MWSDYCNLIIRLYFTTTHKYVSVQESSCTNNIYVSDIADLSPPNNALGGGLEIYR